MPSITHSSSSNDTDWLNACVFSQLEAKLSHDLAYPEALEGNNLCMRPIILILSHRCENKMILFFRLVLDREKWWRDDRKQGTGRCNRDPQLDLTGGHC